MIGQAAIHKKELDKNLKNTIDELLNEINKFLLKLQSKDIGEIRYEKGD